MILMIAQTIQPKHVLNNLKRDSVFLVGPNFAKNNNFGPKIAIFCVH